MANCQFCGSEIPNGANKCPNCGGSVPFNNGSEYSCNDYDYDYEYEDARKNRWYGVLSYLGIMFLIPFLCARNSAFAKYHCNQGIILYIFSTVLSLLSNVAVYGMSNLVLPDGLINIYDTFTIALNLLIWILRILGIIHALRYEKKPLPVIGGFNLIK